MTRRTSRIAALVALLLMFVVPVNSATREPSFVKIVSVTPASGSTVHSGTVIQAELQYHIEPFESRTTRYMLVPMFEAVDHSPFNDLMDGTNLRKRSGTVKVSYPIQRQVADPKLDKPMKYSFALVSSKAGGFIVAGVKSDQVVYEVK
jgi:hypothetical protein